MNFLDLPSYNLWDILRGRSLKWNDIFYVDKPYGLSSFYVVSILRAYCGYKLGHGGTLDPLAIGKLPILVGQATKQQTIFQKAKKVYKFKIVAPFYSATYDLETMMYPMESQFIRERIDTLFSNKNQLNRMLDFFLGSKNYWVYKYSALKKNGLPMYKTYGMDFKEKAFHVYSYEFDLRRVSRNYLIDVIRDKISLLNVSKKLLSSIDLSVQGTFNQINMIDKFSTTIIKSLNLFLETSYRDFIVADIEIWVSGGTYVRVLAYYLSAMLGIPGVIIDLERKNYIEYE